jgi:hypothetical protein
MVSPPGAGPSAAIARSEDEVRFAECATGFCGARRQRQRKRPEWQTDRLGVMYDFFEGLTGGLIFD